MVDQLLRVFQTLKTKVGRSVKILPTLWASALVRNRRPAVCVYATELVAQIAVTYAVPLATTVIDLVTSHFGGFDLCLLSWHPSWG